MKFEATHLRNSLWAVRPEGQLGTCGFYPEPWTVHYVSAPTAEQALAKAARHREAKAREPNVGGEGSR